MLADLEPADHLMTTIEPTDDDDGTEEMPGWMDASAMPFFVSLNAISQDVSPREMMRPMSVFGGFI